MGTRYTTESVSGYNATPPSDDGTVSESNKIKWATIKPKLTDPLNTALANIDSKLTTHFNVGPTALTTSTTLDSTHYNKIIQVSGSGVTLTLSDAATLAGGWYCWICNTDSSNSVTLTRATGGNTINGTAGAYTIYPGQTLMIFVIAATTGFLTISDFSLRGTEIITGNKTFSGAVNVVDGNLSIKGSGDATKIAKFEVDGLTTGTTRTVTIPDADVTLLTVATQADQETGTSTTASVSPGRQQYHPSSCKAWAYVGTVGASPAFTAQYNCASIVQNVAGTYTITFTTAFSSATAFTVIPGIMEDANALIKVTALTASTVQVKIVVAATSASADYKFSIACFGDQ